jgi:endothelin-converting enzyme
VVFAGPRYGVGLPSPSYYKDEATVSAYQSAMAEVLKGVLPNPAAGKAADKLAAAVVQLESKISASTPPLEDLQDSSVSLIRDAVRPKHGQEANDSYRSRTTHFHSRKRRR